MKTLEDLMIAVSKYMYSSIMLLDSVEGSSYLEELKKQPTLKERVETIKEIFLENNLDFDLLDIELQEEGFTISQTRNRVFVCVEIDCIVDGERFKHPVSMELDKVIDLFMNSKTEDK